MSTVSRVAAIGALIGDQARCAMLVALMDGRALTATELARAAGVTPQTASSHLNQLVTSDLLRVIRQGRHRYHSIASPDVARMIEGVLAVAGARASPRPTLTGPRDQQMRRLRTCYDHLAGSIAVAIADSMTSGQHLAMGPDGGRLTAAGEALLGGLGISRSDGFVRPCLDWSERRFHIGGELGARLQSAFLSRGWITLAREGRAVTLTPNGSLEINRLFGVGSGHST